VVWWLPNSRNRVGGKTVRRRHVDDGGAIAWHDCTVSERGRIATAITVIVGFGMFLIWRMFESWGPPEDGMPTTRAQPL
jgi:hypothetical protein